MKIPLTASTDPENVQSIGQLWESLYRFAKGRYEDNLLCGEYPIDVRDMQLVALNALVDAINVFHKHAATIKPKMVCRSCGYTFIDKFDDMLSIEVTGLCRVCTEASQQTNI